MGLFRLTLRKQSGSRPRGDGQRAMFFLMRLAFWIGLVLVLLPTDKSADDANVPEIKAGDAMSAAASAVSDMSQFCTRQPSACAVGSEAASVIGHRAQAGARKVYQMITEKRPDTTGSIDEAHDEIDDAPGLTPSATGAPPAGMPSVDLHPEWQDPVSAPQTVPSVAQDDETRPAQ
jgi:Family of unknown function (DUF5330)